MSLLMRNYPVDTRFGGGFVQSIDGLAGGQEAGAPGRLVLLRQRRAGAEGGGRDERPPGRPRLVGSPRLEPDRGSRRGRRLVPRAVPERHRRQAAAGADRMLGDRHRYACRTVTERLRALGVPAAIAAIGSSGAPETLRVLVGPWPAARAATSTSRASTAVRARAACTRASRGGRALSCSIRTVSAVRTLGAGAGLIAATRRAKTPRCGSSRGTDARASKAPARAFDAGERFETTSRSRCPPAKRCPSFRPGGRRMSSAIVYRRGPARCTRRAPRSGRCPASRWARPR